MKTLVKSVLTAGLLALTAGCSADLSELAVSDRRGTASETRAAVEYANAFVAVADAHVDPFEADAIVDVLAGPRTKTPRAIKIDPILTNRSTPTAILPFVQQWTARGKRSLQTSPKVFTKGEFAMRLFVGNLPRECTEIELRVWFEHHGHVVASGQVIRDRMTGVSRGFAFVELENTSDLRGVITQLHGQQLSGRKLTIKSANPRVPGSDQSYPQQV